jgi:hypothetical protein
MDGSLRRLLSAALLAAGELDYIYDYQSVAESNGFRFIPLPAEIDLSDPNRAAAYRAASATIRGSSPGTKVTVRGEARMRPAGKDLQVAVSEQMFHCAGIVSSPPASGHPLSISLPPKRRVPSPESPERGRKEGGDQEKSGRYWASFIVGSPKKM